MRFSTALLALALVACSAPREKHGTIGTGNPETGSTAQALSAQSSFVLTWGDEKSQVGLVPAATESPARGPEAVAVGPTGQVFLLDAIHQRVLEVADESVRHVAYVPSDASDVTVGPDGVVGVLGALSWKVSLFNPNGAAAGEVQVPTLMREVDGVAIGASRRVTVTTANQARFVVGGPSVPMPVEVALKTQRPGIAAIADGRGVAVVKSEQGIELLVMSAGASDADRTTIDARRLVAPGATAAHVIGAVGNVACMRVETVSQPNGAIDVKRQVLCVDALTGKEHLREDLPAAGLYVPRHELAFGGSPATLVFVHPEDAGLRVSTWKLGGAK